jgi:hypothetical protein
MSPATQQPPADALADEVTAAEQEAAEAEQLLDALEERVRDGDEEITPQQLANARELGRFARLRAEAARRKAERAAAKRAEQQRAEQIAAARKLVEQDAQRAPIGALAARVLDDIRELVAAVDRHDKAVATAARMLRAAGCGPMHEYEQVHRDGMTFREPRPATATPTAPRVAEHGNAVSFGEGTRAPIVAGHLLAALFGRAAAGVPAPPGEQSLARLLATPAQRHRDLLDGLLAAAEKNGK